MSRFTVLLIIVLSSVVLLCCGQVTSPFKNSCDKCERRPAIGKLGCSCSNKKFCNEKTYQCEQCDACFNAWDVIVGKSNNEVQIRIQELVDKYNVDLGSLENLLQELSTKTENASYALRKLDTLLDRTRQDAAKVSEKIDVLMEDLQKIKRELNSLNLEPSDLTKILMSIVELGNKIRKLLNDISEIKFIDSAEVEVEEYKKKLTEILNYSYNFNKTFPDINTNSSLNLALHTESGIDFIESVILSDPKQNTDAEYYYNTTAEALNKTLDDIVALVVNALKQDKFSEFQDGINQLQETALTAKYTAKGIESALANAEEKEKRFREQLKQLQQEKEHYDEIEHLQDDLRNLTREIDGLENSNKNFSREVTLSAEETNQLEKEVRDELSKYHKEEEQFSKKMEKLERSRGELDKLLEDALIQREVVEGMEEFMTVDELDSEIEDMLKKIDLYTKYILEYCKESRPVPENLIKNTI